MRCHLRHWAITSLAVALSSRQLKDLGVVDWDCCQERMPGGHEELGRDVGKGGKECEGSRWKNLRERPVSGMAWRISRGH